jgi:hypothetical protein
MFRNVELLNLKIIVLKNKNIKYFISILLILGEYYFLKKNKKETNLVDSLFLSSDFFENVLMTRTGEKSRRSVDIFY